MKTKAIEAARVAPGDKILHNRATRTVVQTINTVARTRITVSPGRDINVLPTDIFTIIEDQEP